MKDRVLLLGPCGGCKDHSKNKQKWNLLGNIMRLFNSKLNEFRSQGYSNNQAQAMAGAVIQSVIQQYNNSNAAQQTGPLPYTPNAYNIDNITKAEYDRIGAACGFGR